MSDGKDWLAGVLPPWNFSLLYPTEKGIDAQKDASTIDLAAQRDLDLSCIAAAFTANKDHQKEIYQIICLLIQDPDVIHYRQDILEDLLAHPNLVERLKFLFPVIDSLVRYAYRTEKEVDSLQEVIWRMGELQNVLDCIQGLEDIFVSLDGELHSKGLRILQEEVRGLQKNPTLQHLSVSCRSCLRNCAPVSASRFLLNESLSSTSSGESLYLAQDIVRILRRLGTRVVYSTHIHELAQRVDELNDSVEGGSKIVSIVSSPVDTDPQVPAVEIQRTYKVEPRPPLGQSYAREIAARYGISYEQLEKMLAERGELSVRRPLEQE